MFKKGLVEIFTLLLIFTACDSTKESDNQTADTPPEKESKEVKRIESTTYIQWEEVMDNCEGEECTRIEVKYPSFSETRINQRVESIVKKEIGNFIRDEKGLNTVKDYTSEFLADYKSFKKEFPESNTAWYLDVSLESLFSTDQWVCIKTVTDSYTGGAHSNNEVSIDIFDKNGRSISPENYIINREKILIIAEEEFRDQKNISKDVKWEDTEFFFEDNQFHLPDNLGFTEKGMVIYFNSYEISSYAEGATEIVLPYKEIKEYIEF